jgi:hypothetical protein
MSPTAYWPESIPYTPGQPVPPGYVQESRPTRALVIAGAITLGVGYLGALAMNDEGAEARSLYIPIVGPWLSLTSKGSDPSDIIVDGAVQLVGTGLLAWGLAWRSDWLVRIQPVPVALPGARSVVGGWALDISGPL